MSAKSSVDGYINREVEFAFSGHRFRFALSLGLFSSQQIDSGSRLLLKSLAGHEILSRARCILDAGSGVGVLGSVLGGVCPEATIVFQDRDALAVEFSRRNAEANGVVHARFEGALAFESSDSAYDLVVANIPAKAGSPVLEMFCRRAIEILKPTGIAVFVVVSSLASSIRGALCSRSRIVHEESGPRHVVFHAVPGDSKRPKDAFDYAKDDRHLDPSYTRQTASFTLGGSETELDTVYGVGEFDTASFATVVAATLVDRCLRVQMKRAQNRANILHWNTGQGLLTTYTANNVIASVDIAGRDLLALRTTAHNLARHQTQTNNLHHLSSLSDLSSALHDRRNSFAIVVAHLAPVSRVPEHDYLLAAADQLLQAEGLLLVYGSAQVVHRLLSAATGFSMMESKKSNGARAVVLRLKRK